MVLISIRELLPTAHRLDPQDKYVSVSLLSGMAVMGLASVLIVMF
jgi:zinc transporter, ZIP family